VIGRSIIHPGLTVVQNACPRPIAVVYLADFENVPIFVSWSIESCVTRDSMTMLQPSFVFTVKRALPAPPECSCDVHHIRHKLGVRQPADSIPP